MSRSTLAVLIQQVRTLTGASTADWILGTANYWDGDQIELVLDRHRIDIDKEPLAPVEKWVGGGTVQYFEHRSQYGNLEATDGGSAVFWLEDSVGADQGTANWSADYQRGIVTFTADQAGSARYLSARSYDVFGAAAELLRAWANREKLSFDFSTDGQSFKRAQKAQMLMEMASEYEMQAWPVTVQMSRSDVGGR